MEVGNSLIDSVILFTLFLFSLAFQIVILMLNNESNAIEQNVENGHKSYLRLHHFARDGPFFTR